MKIKNLLALSLCLVMVFALAACGGGASPDAVVAEGTGHSSHGYEVEVLLQEFGDGSAKLNVCYHSEDYGVHGVQYTGTVTKGTDSDGDPVVTLHIDSGYIGDISPDAVDLSYNYDDPTTNTYDASTGEYTIVVPISVFGYADKEVTIDMKKPSTATDAMDWFKGYGLESLEVKEIEG